MNIDRTLPKSQTKEIRIKYNVTEDDINKLIDKFCDKIADSKSCIELDVLTDGVNRCEWKSKNDYIFWEEVEK